MPPTGPYFDLLRHTVDQKLQPDVPIPEGIYRSWELPNASPGMLWNSIVWPTWKLMVSG